MTVELKAGDLSLVLDPETGGAIASFTYRGIALLRPVSDTRLGAQHGRTVAGYPLIPFANRVAAGRFSFAGQSYQLARNFGDDPNAIHGNAWMRPWTVAGSGDRDARLVLDFKPVGGQEAHWPFAYRAEQHIALEHDRVRITLSVRNQDTRPFPAGLGLHPYVARSPESVLRFEADSFWTTGVDGLPVAREAVHGALEFSDGRLLGAQVIDTCYAGWAGQATVTRPEDGLTIVLNAAAPLDHLQVYTPAGRDFLGLEPVSNMPDAVSRMEEAADHGLVVLQPGEVLTGTVELGVRVDGD